MKIKTKLTLGVGLLFLLIIILSVVGVKYSYELKQDSENILRANYNSLEYSQNMLSSLQKSSNDSNVKFEFNLKKQERNITEVGEKESTEGIRKHFNLYIQDKEDSVNIERLREKILETMELNMQAIQLKSEIAKSTADKAVFWIGITGISCLVIAFMLLINLPANIAHPIQKLTKSIKEIALKNYSERVNFESHNEFGELAKSFNTMAIKLEEYNTSSLAKLMMEKKRIETLINNMHDPVIGLDEGLKVIFANEEAIKIIGICKEEMIGKTSENLGKNNDLIRTLTQDLLKSKNEEGTKLKTIKIYSGNKEGYFEKETHHISITPTGENITALIGHVIILRNITEYKELDSAKTNFIATVSHEFKTPIASIKMSLQLLGKEEIGNLNVEQQNLVDSIRDDADRLLKITSELLNMTQIESGNIQLAILPCDPIKIVHEAILANQTPADQKQISFEVDNKVENIEVNADGEKTTWVMTNLISNAIRYSHENSRIYLSIKKQNEFIVFEVRDTGQGISPEYMDKIFDRYFRVPGTKNEGTGLGLAISKEFIEAQNGKIEVESEYGAGSTFRIVLKANK